MKLRCSLISLLLLFVSMHGFTNVEIGKDTLATKSKAYEKGVSINKFVKFPELDKKFPIKNLIGKITSPEFTFQNLRKEFPVTEASIKDSKTEAKAGFKEIENSGSWISSFGNDDIQELPVGIKKKLNEVEYQLGFTKARFTKEYTELTVFVRIILPQTDAEGVPIELFFGANNVKLSHQGGLMGNANLVLLGDVFIPFNAGNWLLLLKGGFDFKTGDTQNKTYVTINCDGVKEMGLDGEVQFSRTMLLPVDTKGKILEETRSYTGADKKVSRIPNRVRGNFKAVASNWNDLIVEIGITPFVLTNQKDKFMFSVNKAIFDFSDLRTENVTFPKHYYEKGLLLPSEESWRGVFVQSLEVSLPKEFKTKESISKDQRVSFKATNLLIDSYGVSGQFDAENVIPLDSGRTSESKGWAMSVDKIGIELASNRLVEADFSGRIVLPISDNGKDKQNNGEKMGLGYKGIISEEEYGLVVSVEDTLAFHLFQAKAELLPNSAVELLVKDGSFLPKAVLNGRMSISANKKDSLDDKGSKIVEFKGIEFQNLVLQTASPAISVDYFGYKGEVKLSNFPVSIADIAFKYNEYEAGIEFDLKINLMSKGFAADTRLGIYGKSEEKEYKQRWKYDRIDISKIRLKADMGAIKLDGSLLIMDDDAVYGDGFSGEIKGDFGSFGGITCKAIFGKNEFRYWYVDAAVTGLKIQVGPLQVNGFAGGAYYKMSRRPNAGSDFSPSGLSYIPDESTRLGLKAAVFGAIGDENVIALSAGFEIEFNKSAGVNRMGLYGEAQAMKAFSFENPLAKLSEKLNGMLDNEITKGLMDTNAGKTFMDKATEEYPEEIVGESSVSAKFAMELDFINDTFHATLDLYINIGSVIQGRASRGRAGWGVVHISPDEWYVHMGTPTDRLGLKMGLGPVSMEVGGYFMTGDGLPGSPPPPPEVAYILGVDAEVLDYMRDENQLSSGRGIAFGTDFKIDTGELRFLIFYARFQAGLGFDIMLKDYGDARCTNTGDEVGIDGWYANGQAYAYLQGELGIKIKLFSIKKKISIIKGGTAILLQAKGPNPFWMRGYAGGYFDLLGGLIKGSYRFKITLGKECVFEDASPLGGIKMITDLTPKEGNNDVDVFAAPQATFAMKVNQPIIIPEDDGDKTYKVVLEKFVVVDENGKEIVGIVEWGYMNDRVTFISEDILPPETRLKAIVEVSFQQKINGVFKTILEDGKKIVEYEERNFTTGSAPDHIPLHNIQYSYPVVDQQLFYSGEYSNGYIKLQRGQDYLFDNTKWQSRVNYVDNNGKIEESTFNYNNAENKVSYTIPKIDKETKYLMSIVSFTKSSNDSNQNITSTDIKDIGENNKLEIRKNKAVNVIKEGEIERLSYEFKSSGYRTFAAKVKAIQVTDNNWGKITSDVVYLTSKIENHEGFDIVELIGNKYSEQKSLVSIESTLKDDYLLEDIDPILYQYYGINKKYTISRDPSVLGFRPKRALPISSNYLTSLTHGVDLNWRAINFPYRYNLPEVYKVDYLDIRNKVINDHVDGIISDNDPTLQILESEYLFIRHGNYNVKLTYTLPGGRIGSSAYYKFKNPMKIR